MTSDLQSNATLEDHFIPRPHALHLLILILICAAAFAFRAEGIYWPKLHPDEHPVGGWIAKIEQHAFIRDRVYANGYFILAKPIVKIYKACAYARNWMAYRMGLAERIAGPAYDGIMLGRWINVIMGAFTCLLAFADYLSADRIGLGLETFVAWHPGALPIRNIRENVIVLTRIFHKPKRLVENPLPPQ